MAYTLAALDMDGTLLNTNHEITPRSKAVIARAAQAGKLVALSTGRCLSELREHLAAIPGIAYVIGENGACVYDVERERVIQQIVLKDAAVESALCAAEGLHALGQCFIDNQSYMEGGPDDRLLPYHIRDFAGVFEAGSIFVPDIGALCAAHRGHIEKINLYFSNGGDRDAFLKRIQGAPVALSDSIGLGCEISPPEATKARGLRALCDHLNLSTSRTIAVGDGGNDIDIMSAAGLSVAMANAIPEVLALAHAITGDCDHDGAAEALERYLLEA